MVDDLPEALRRSHPELVAVGAALESHRDGRPVTARCPTCHGLLTVTSTPSGGLYVTCPNGCTTFRARTRRPDQ